MGFGGWRGTFWLQKKALTFQGPVAQQTSLVYRPGMHTIPPKLHTLHNRFISPSANLKSSLRNPYMGHSAVDG
jgi:hypothetical protein